jgi:hypothetical protein
MIIPVFPADLERNTGMKKAARFLFKNWPGVKPILRTQSLDILAKGLGFESYHHVRKLASSWNDSRPDVDIHSIEWNLSKVLSEEFRAPGNPGVTINLGNLLAYIQTIPLHHLTVFKRFPELLDGRHSFPLLPYDKQSPFGRFQHSPVVPHEADWRIPDYDESEEPGQL